MVGYKRVPSFAPFALVSAVQVAAKAYINRPSPARFTTLVSYTALTMFAVGCDMSEKERFYQREADGTFSSELVTAKSVIAKVGRLLDSWMDVELPKMGAQHLVFDLIAMQDLLPSRRHGAAFTSSLDANPLHHGFADGIMVLSPASNSYEFFQRGSSSLPADVYISTPRSTSTPAMAFSSVSPFRRGVVTGGALVLSDRWHSSGPDSETWTQARVERESPAFAWLKSAYGEARSLTLLAITGVVVQGAGAALKAAIIIWSAGANTGKSAFLSLLAAACGDKSAPLEPGVLGSEAVDRGELQWLLRSKRSALIVKDWQSIQPLAARLAIRLGNDDCVTSGRGKGRDCSTATNAVILIGTNFAHGAASMKPRASKLPIVNDKMYLLEFASLASPPLEQFELTEKIAALRASMFWAGVVAALTTDCVARVKSLPTLASTIKDSLRTPEMNAVIRWVRENIDCQRRTDAHLDRASRVAVEDIVFSALPSLTTSNKCDSIAAAIACLREDYGVDAVDSSWRPAADHTANAGRPEGARPASWLRGCMKESGPSPLRTCQVKGKTIKAKLTALAPR